MASRGTNNDVLERISTDDFSSGGLTEEQFNRFFKEVQNESDVLDRTRAVSVTAPSGDIPQLDVKQRSLQAVNEGEAADLQNIQQPSVPYQTQKVSLPYEFTWEALNETVDDPEKAVAQMFVTLFSNDLSRLASIGDTSSSDPFESTIDGWLTQAQANSNTQTYDHSGDPDGDGTTSPQPVNKSLFRNMIRALPRRYRDRDGLVFLASPDAVLEWKDYVAERKTAQGDAMLLSQSEPSAFGIPLLTPLEWPDDVMLLTNRRNLCYVIQGDKVRVEQAEKGKDMVMHDIAAASNLLAKLDYAVLEYPGVVVGSNISIPA
jgi:hypothetical protein